MARKLATQQQSPFAPELAPAAKAGVVVNLFQGAAHPNAALLKRQYNAQRAMLNENMANQAASAINPDLLKVQYQRATRTPAQETTIREQAQMQGLRGAAFKL